MAFSLPVQPTKTFEGRVEGLILSQQQGDGGFGYDPLFWLPEFDCTMAELSLDIKNRISHRGHALRQIVEYLAGTSA